MISISITNAVSDVIHTVQKCIRGRQMGDNILDIEAKAIQFALTNATLATVFAFDISAERCESGYTLSFYLPQISHIIFPNYFQ